MSETYPRKNLCETLFTGHISLQRRIRVQRYNKICGFANFVLKKILGIFLRVVQQELDWWRDNTRNTQMLFGKMNKHFQRKVVVAGY